MTDQEYIEIAKKKICEKMMWPHWSEWTHYNFEKLSTMMEKETRIKPSTSTLKRVFNKVSTRKSFNPNHNTKDTFAAFLGYIDWEDFRINNGEKQTIDISVPEKKKNKRKYQFTKKFWIVTVIFVVTGTFLFYFLRKPEKVVLLDPDSVDFTTSYTPGSYPSNVAISYSLPEVEAGMFFIDMNDHMQSQYKRIIEIKKKQGVLNHYYAYPDMYRVQLKQKEETIKDLHVYVLSNGWRKYLKSPLKEMPIFVPRVEDPKEFITTKHQAAAYGIDTMIYYESSFVIVDTFQVDANNFRFRLQMKNHVERWETYCNANYVILQTDGGDIIRFRYTNPECQHQARIGINNWSVSGKHADLSELGVDISEWVEVAIVFERPYARFYLNEKMVYETSYKEELGQFRKMSAIFNSSGEIRNIELTDTHTEKSYSWNEE